MNKIVIDGLVARSPFRGTTKSGNPYQRFSLLNVEKTRMSEVKTYVEVDDWSVACPVSEGMHIQITGRLYSSSYDDKVTGKKVWKLKINAENIIPMDEILNNASASVSSDGGMTDLDVPF